MPIFLDINPNGRIPALVDDNIKTPDGKGHQVFESASIMLWLVENYDQEYKFWFKDPVERSQALSWIYFIHGGESSRTASLACLLNAFPLRLCYVKLP